MLHWMLFAAVISLQILTPSGSGPSGCLAVSGLSRAQRRVCSRASLAAASALDGMRAAVLECRHQLRRHRWDCGALKSRAANPHSAPIMSRGYRESAFVYALASAGVAHSVSRACAQGQLLACGCDPSSYKPGGPEPGGAAKARPPSSRWKWGGCSHNMQYGLSFSRQFLDSRETAGDLQSRVNLHNNEAGRLAVSNNMEVRCKCHGMSGSCQVRTCWRAAPPLRAVGRVLRRRYRGALLMGRGNDGRPVRQRGRTRGRYTQNTHKTDRWGPTKKWHENDIDPPPESLLYYERSPSYCERDTALDVPGTAGRRCARDRTAPGSCAALCCGRGYDLVRTRKSQRCRCRFHWCCKVECDTCEREEWIAVCK